MMQSLPLPERLAAIVDIINESNKRIEQDQRYDGTGYLCFRPELLATAVQEVLEQRHSGISLDMGCGNGAWLLLAAAAGFTSYGIEIHSLLVDEARKNYKLCVERNLISRDVQVHIAIGNFYQLSEKEAMIKFRGAHRENEKSMPWDDVDAYALLNITLHDVDVLYAWSWPTQSRFLYNFLARSTRSDTIFVLPAYIRYTQGEHMNASLQEPNTLLLERLSCRGDVFIGKRID